MGESVFVIATYTMLKTAAGFIFEENIMNTKDEIHIIGSWKSVKHVKFDKDHTFQNFPEIRKFVSFDRMFGTLTAYISSKDVILMFRESTGDKRRDFRIRESS